MNNILIKNNIPLVSVLIPLYNSENHISQTIEAVLAQTYPNIETIIVDDGSSDKSHENAQLYKSDKVKVFKQTNQGACAARNFAFKQSKGEYIQYLDADDLLSSNKIEQQINLLLKQSETVASCSWEYFHDKPNDMSTSSQSIDKSYPLPIDWLIDSWNGKGMGQTSVWLTPRNLIEEVGGWNEKLKINQDGEFFCRVLLRTKSIVYSNEAKVYYRIGQANSVSRTNSHDKLASQLLSFDLYEQHVKKHNRTSPETRYALLCVFSDFYIRTLIPYPDLADQALQRIHKLGYSKPTTQGGKYFRLLSKFIGLLPAIKIRHYLSHS